MKTKLLTALMVFTCVSASTNLLHAGAGSLDLTFNPGSGADGQINCIALETNGQIVIGGSFTHYNGVSQNHIARLNADGSLDSSFYPGVGPNGNLTCVAAQPNGEIFIAGGYSQLNGLSWNQPALLRLDGSVDTGFNTQSANGVNNVNAMVLQTDGKVVVGGNFGVSIARFNTNGTADATFNPGTGANATVSTLGIQSNGQIIVGGYFTSVNNSNRIGLARLNANGSVDSTFNALIQSGNVYSLVVTPQDKIVIGGTFTSINGYSRNYIARLNADGSVDTGFNPGSGASSYVTSVAIQTNGQVIISGALTSFNGTSVAGGLARLNTNGTLDVTFNTGTGPNGSIGVLAMVGQPDGRNLIAGQFTSFNGTNINRIARLSSATSSMTLNLLNANNYFGMFVQGTVGYGYRVEYASKLNTTNLWTPLTNLTLQANPQFIYDPTTTATGARFYRAVQISP